MAFNGIYDDISSGYDMTNSLPWKDPPFFMSLNHLFRLGPSKNHGYWVNYHISLNLAAIWGSFPILTMIIVRENSEVVMKFTQNDVRVDGFPLYTGWWHRRHRVDSLKISQDGIFWVSHFLLHVSTSVYWLVVSIPLKNIRQLGWLFPIYGKIKNVLNHQPGINMDWFFPLVYEHLRTAYMIQLWIIVWLVVSTPLKNYESQLGRIIPYMMEQKTCSKPPTSSWFEIPSYSSSYLMTFHFQPTWPSHIWRFPH